MKRIPQLLALALLAVSLIACTPARGAPVAHAAPAAQAAPLEQPEDAPLAPAQDTPRTITVVGAGKVSLVPDVARINVGAEVRADTVSEAKGEVDRQIAAIRAALTTMGVEARDIQTNHYSIHYEREMVPLIGEGPPPPAQEGYRVSNMLRVTVRDVERAGEVLDAIVEAGANQVYGVNFAVSEQDQWLGQAREKAMADANARAAELARLAGVELGEVLSVSKVIGALMAPMTMELGFRSGSGGFALGELEVGTQVQVTFAVQ